MMGKKILLNVEGMSCGHCQAAVEKAVQGLAGVSEVKVDLAGKKVEVEYEPGKVTEEEIKNAIEDQGYEVV